MRCFRGSSLDRQARVGSAFVLSDSWVILAAVGVVRMVVFVDMWKVLYVCTKQQNPMILCGVFNEASKT